MRTRRPSILAMALTLLVAGVAPAQAQSLPNETVTSPTLTNPQKDAIRDFVRANQDALLSEDDLECQTARKRLSEPLGRNAVSLAFRREYSGLLMPTIQAGTKSADDHVAVNCLLLAGRLATPEAADHIERALADPRVPVRYASVNSVTLLLDQVNVNSPAIPEARVIDMMRRLGDVIRDDSNELVFDAGVRALIAGMTQSALPDVRPVAVSQLATNVAQRIRQSRAKSERQTLVALHRAADAFRSYLINDVNNTDTAAARNAAELSGHVLAFVAERIDAGDFNANPEPEVDQARTAVGQILGNCEATIFLVNDGYLKGGRIPAWELATKFEADDENLPRFIEESIIGPTGKLTEAPFSQWFDDGTFERR